MWSDLLRRARFGLALGASALLLYVVTLAPSIVPGDGPELTVAARFLGIPHPSGYPLYVMGGRLASLLPAGTVAWRLNLFAAVAGAAAVGLFGAWLRRATGSTAASLAASAMLALSPSLWRESTSAEVYSFSLFFLALLLHFLPDERDARRLPLAAYLWGLALTNHLGLVLLLPAFAGWTVLRVRPSRKTLLLAKACFLVGLTPYALLPVRAADAPLWNWGDPSNLKRFLDHVSGAPYWGYFGGGSAAERLGGWASALGSELTPLAYVAIPAGIVFLARKRRDLLVPVLGGAAIALAYALLYGIHDPEAYFLPVHLLLLVPVAFLVAGLGRLAPVAAVLLAAAAAVGAPRHAPRDREVLVEHLENVYATIEEGGSLVVHGDAETFGLLYMSTIEGRRPDLALWNPALDLLPAGGVLGRLDARPERRGPGWKASALAEAVRRGDPVYAATESDDVRPGSDYSLEPYGILYRYVRVGDPGAAGRREEVRSRYRTTAVLGVAASSGYLARILAASYPIQDARRLLLDGREEEARASLERALSLAGDDAAPIVNNVALAYRAAGDPDRARALLLRAARASRDRLPVLNLARLDRDEGRTADAEARYLEVIEEDAGLRFEALLECGAMLLGGAEPDRALGFFRRAAEERPWEAGPHVGIGEALLARGDAEGARLSFREAERRRAGMARLGELRIADEANRSAWELAEEGRSLPRALELALEARLADGANASYADTEGWVLYKLGRFEEAARSLGEARRLGLAGAGVLFRHGLALAGAGRTEEAGPILQEALREEPASPHAPEAKRILEGGALRPASLPSKR